MSDLAPEAEPEHSTTDITGSHQQRQMVASTKPKRGRRYNPKDVSKVETEKVGNLKDPRIVYASELTAHASGRNMLGVIYKNEGGQNICIVKGCGKKYNLYSPFKLHLCQAHADLVQAENESVLAKAPPPYSIKDGRFHCGISGCNMHYERLRRLSRHYMNKHVGGQHGCWKCDLAFDTQWQRNTHLRRGHNVGSFVFCPYENCDLVFPWDRLDRHQGDVHAVILSAAEDAIEDHINDAE